MVKFLEFNIKTLLVSQQNAISPLKGIESFSRRTIGMVSFWLELNFGMIKHLHNKINIIIT